MKIAGIATVLLFIGFLAFSQVEDPVRVKNKETMTKKMKVEIWSDVMCPFCYIGKRKFEKALEQFPESEFVELEWKSFQLSPDMKTDPSKSIHQFLAEHKGVSLDQAKSMNGQVAQMAAGEGLIYNFDKTVVANSFNAHRFAHFTKQHDKQNEAEELLFKAYFTEGKNIDDYSTLVQLGNEIGLDSDKLQAALENNEFADDVRADMAEAREIGVTGVPFFVFDRKKAVSGAQPVEVFSETLEETFAEWRKENPESKMEVIEGKLCKPDADCD